MKKLLIIVILFAVLLSACTSSTGNAKCEVFTPAFSNCNGSISGNTVTLNIPESSKYKGELTVKEVSAYECSNVNEALLSCNTPVSCTITKNENPFTANCQFQSGKFYAVEFKLRLIGSSPSPNDVPQDLPCNISGIEAQVKDGISYTQWDCEISYFRVSGKA
jgi:hypothetical protein